MNQKFIDDSPVFNRNNSFCTYLKGKIIYSLPVLIAQLRSADFLKFDMGQVYVMIAFSIFPVIIVYILLSRFIVEGVSAGAVKG